jgi:hypothetical protein
MLGLAAGGTCAQVTVDDAGSARNGKVGAFGSLVVGADEVAIGYYCERDSGGPGNGGNALRFAWKVGDCWQWTTVAPGGSAPSMARDASGEYHVVFEGWNGLSWAHGRGNVWTVSGTRVDSGAWPSHASMVLDASGRPHVAYMESLPGGRCALRYTRWDGSAWLRGGAELVAGSVWTPTIGFSNTMLALDTAGVPHVVFAAPQDGVNARGKVEYATLLNGQWFVESLGFLGVDPTLRIGSDNVARIAFRRGRTLVYAERVHGIWSVEAVASAAGSANIGSISLALGPADQPCIAFETTNDESVYVARRAAGGWTAVRIDGGAGSSSGAVMGRFGIGVAIDAGGAAHVAYSALTIFELAAGRSDHRSDLRYFTTGIWGDPCSLASGACCNEVSGACTWVSRAGCGAGRTWNGSVSCSPTLCSSSQSPGWGACCGGATCVARAGAECVGPNRRFAGVGIACNAVGAANEPCCRADFDQNLSLTIQDVFAFLSAWFAGDPLADIGLVGSNTIQDVFDYLAAWFSGC